MHLVIGFELFCKTGLIIDPYKLVGLKSLFCCYSLSKSILLKYFLYELNQIELDYLPLKFEKVLQL